MRTAEPLTPQFSSSLCTLGANSHFSSSRHGGSCLAAVRPHARPALAEALRRQPGGPVGGPVGGPAPTRLLRRGQPEDAVARTQPGESPVTLSPVCGLALAAVTYRRLSNPGRLQPRPGRSSRRHASSLSPHEGDRWQCDTRGGKSTKPWQGLISSFLNSHVLLVSSRAAESESSLTVLLFLSRLQSTSSHLHTIAFLTLKSCLCTS